MLADDKDKPKAFTIIEVVLVLAVAGLIFLVVFAAIPRLQASRRDNQRKRDAEALFSAIIDLESNSGNLLTYAEYNSAFAATPSGPLVPYLPQGLEKPEGGDYIAAIDWPTFDDTPSSVIYHHNRECNADGTRNALLASTTARDRALVMKLERGSYCLDGK